MALRPCKECGREVSSSALNCPYCGKKHPAFSFFGWKFLATIFGFAAAVVVIAIISGQQEYVVTGSVAGDVSETPIEAPVRTGEWALTRAGWPICLSRDALDQYLSLDAAGDQAALAKLFEGGSCVMSADGVRVYVEGRLSLGVREIRPEGETVTFVTVTETVEPE